MYPNQENYP